MSTVATQNLSRLSKDFSRQWLLFGISRSFWNGELSSDKVAEVAATAESANKARIRGKILALERKALAPISSPMSALLRLWKRGDGDKLHGTRPWRDGGLRLVPTDEYPLLREKVDALVRQVNDGIREVFRVKYDEIKSNAEKELNGFIEGIFPSKETMMAKYAVRVYVDHVSSTECPQEIEGLSPEQVAEIQKERDEYWGNMLTEGNRETIKDVFATVEALKERLSDKNCRFHGTVETGFPIFDNIERMVARCEKFNVNQDPEVASLCKDVRDMLNDIDPQQVKEDPKARKSAASKAQKMMDALSKF